MVKRLLSFVASDFAKELTRDDFKQAIKSSDGRTILVEIAAVISPLFSEVTNAEIASAFGADMLLVKHLDYSNPEIVGFKSTSLVSELKKLSGIAVGLNLEITDDDPKGRQANEKNITKAVSLNPDFLSLTGYEKPEVTSKRVVHDIQMVRKYYQGFLMVDDVVGHGSDLNVATFLDYVHNGADLITLPAPGTVPGSSEGRMISIIDQIRQAGALVSLTTSTSQEGTDTQTNRLIALSSKRAGADVFAFGDSGISGIADPMDIMATSLAIRGKKHTYVNMARSATR